MKTIQKMALYSLLMITITQLIKASEEEQETAQSTIMHIEKELTILNHIALQAQIIIESVILNEKYDNSNAKNTIVSALAMLNQFKSDLNPYIKNMVSEEINIIENSTIETIEQSLHAYKILISKIEAINTQAYVARTTQEATTKVAQIPTNNIKNEISWAKAAFYTGVSAATLAALYYGYQHKNDIAKKVHTSWWNMMKRVSGYKDPFDYFLQNLQKLQQITSLTYEAKKQFDDNPTPENLYIFQSMDYLQNQQINKTGNAYERLNPAMQEKAAQIADKVMGP